MRRLLVLVVACSVGLGACSTARVADVDLAIANVPRASASLADAIAASNGINDFGLELFRSAVASDVNAVLSPASIAIALGMARAGARGATAAEMDAVLREVASDDHAAWLNALDQALSSRSGTYPDANGDDQEVTLRIANAPFAQRGLRIEAAFLEALASRYGAGLRLVDYLDDAEGARQLINAWVDDQTEHRIPELLVPGVIGPMTRLTLVNATYLKAPWETPFVEEATTDGPFLRGDGSSVQVPMMQLSAPIPYAEGNGWRAVELPYVGGALAMTIIVPDDLAALEAGLDGAGLAAIVGALAAREVRLELPRFSTESKVGLADVLRAMGMPTAFAPGEADFSGITTEEMLYISDVIHQANIDVDESGTEAAAATAVVMRATSGPSQPVELQVDRPFLFALRDVRTGAVLFLGHIVDPSIGR
jgi:serpin B